MKEDLAYRIEIINRGHHGYGHTYITIVKSNPQSVVERIATCTKDPAYYGKPDEYESLARLGHDTIYRLPHDMQVVLHWQHYDSDDGHKDYCQHSIDGPSRLGVMQWACKLLTGISRNIAKAQGEYYGPKDCYQYRLNKPWNVVDELERMGAQRIELVTTGAYQSNFVKGFSLLPEWRGKEEEAA